MIRQLLKFAIVLVIGVSPIAHELCQLSCEAPAVAAASTSSKPSAHAHCAEAARSSEHVVVLARATTACQSASDRQDVGPVVAKANVHSLMPVAVAFHAPLITRGLRIARDQHVR